MEIRILRNTYTPNSTVGKLHIDDHYFCKTLEDRVRAPGVKVAGATCIPEGRYRMIVDWSPNHEAFLPHLLDVPMFTGIRIHPGNTMVDTEGCILPGLQAGPDMVTQSRVAFYAFCELLSAPILKGEEMWVTIGKDPDVEIPEELLKTT